MSVDAKTTTQTVRPVTTRGLVRLRRGSLAVLVLIVAEYVIRMYVNLYVALPRADHGSSLDHAVSAGGHAPAGPAMLSIHAVAGLLLGLGALGVSVQAVLVRHWGLAAAAAVGLFALVLASVAGAGFTSSGDAAESMAMAVMTGVALLCYAAILYLLRPPAQAR